MSRTVLNFALDTGLLAIFVLLAWSSVVLRFVFPPGPAATGWRLWNLTYNDWASLQFALVAALALGILVHVMLHWTWVCGVVAKRCARSKGSKPDEGTQTLYGVGLLIVLVNILGMAIAAAALSIERPM